MAKWERWSVNKEVPAKLELQALIDDKDGLKLDRTSKFDFITATVWLV